MSEAEKYFPGVYAGDRFCAACFCSWGTLHWPRTCCYSDIFTNGSPPYCCFPCCGSDCTFPTDYADELDNVPVTCTLLPFFPTPTLYPSFACCPTVAALYPEVKENRSRAKVDKSNYQILCSCCIPSCCATNNYITSPMESCFVRDGECCCFTTWFSLPCVPRHPRSALAIYGLVLYPTLACCPRMDSVFPELFEDGQK
uniref:Uncharacterized protein n=1 Tax=Pinguiococcus pyrenoidosus TaxID=172671 RepID=A0A7R9UD58_9STRA|mmetsp:Transcript_5969/g.23176  ORF Transcript_5969/g.23176 Transcript_5969/m.23176 type:complete len:199 (+) Transcript_5969:126-722(+)